MIPILRVAIVSVWLGLLSGGRVHAQTCTAAATGVAFGIYVPLTGPALTTTGTITVTCQALIALFVNYTITLSVGSGTSYATRSMGGPSPPLGYQLYRDAAYSQVWGDGTAGTFTIVAGYLLSVLVPVVTNYTVYGRIPAGEAGSVGAYTDMVTVTVTY